MIIKVDHREQELIKQIKQLVLFTPIFKDIKVITENLPIGDIIISDEIEDKIIIERKSLNDLLASIKDGRYEEQSYRLNGLSTHNHNIYYLIEGDINKFNGFKEKKADKMTLYSAIFSLNYYKGFSVMRTQSLEETAIFICNTTSKLKKSEVSGRKPFYQNSLQSLQPIQINSNVENGINISNIEDNIVSELEQTDKDYISVIKRVKKDNITPDNIDEIMLCQIPGISSITSIAIMNHFKTIPNLIEQLNNNQECLQNITYINGKGQSRKINKTSIVNLVKFLLKK
uniref:ERCC4 domain-containing protein n=1 Tax=viral metagenome TaxID=1070528 RepID=A0A6C0ERL2_9ZZZZ